VLAAGLIKMLVYTAEPLPLPASVLAAVSVVFAFTVTVIAPWWVPALMASRAAFRVVYVVGPWVPAVAVTLIWAKLK